MAGSKPATLDDFLNSRSPGLDALRLVLAFLVLVSHTWPLGGFGREPLSPMSPNYLTLGGFAVAGFFGLSGMLVGRSALSRPTGSFTRARMIRIVPAYWLALVVSGIVAAGIGWLHVHRGLGGFMTIEPGGPVGYVARNALFPSEVSYQVHDVFAGDTPYGIATGQSFVNGSLWTLPYEMRCYLVVGLVAIAARRFGRRRSVTLAWAAIGAIAVAYAWSESTVDYVIGPYANRQLVAFVFVFVSGTLASVWADRITLFGPVPLIALGIGLAASHNSLFLAEHVGGAALVLILPPIAAVLAPIGRKLRGVDISYGLYLFAWPVQQVLAMYGVGSTATMFIIWSTIITAVLAASSWLYVERPLMTRWRPTATSEAALVGAR